MSALLVAEVGGPGRSFDTKLILCRIILKTPNQGGAARGAAGPASAPRSALGGPRGARRAPQPRDSRQISTAHPSRNQTHAPSPAVLPGRYLPRSTTAGSLRQDLGRAAGRAQALRQSCRVYAKSGPNPAAFPSRGAAAPRTPAPRGSGRPRCFSPLPPYAGGALFSGRPRYERRRSASAGEGRGNSRLDGERLVHGGAVTGRGRGWPAEYTCPPLQPQA